MLRAAAETYAPELSMVTCSSVSKETVDSLARDFPFPVLKIDYPMARRAVRAGRRIGVAATFPPTLAPTSRLLRKAAAEAGAERSEEHTSELQSRQYLVCRLLLEKKK